MISWNKISIIVACLVIPILGMGQGKVTRTEPNPHPAPSSVIPKAPSISIKLATDLGEKRIYYSLREWDNLKESEKNSVEIVGLVIESGSEKFLMSMKPLPNWSNWQIAQDRTGNQMPTKRQWQIIKHNKTKIQDALSKFGGGYLSTRRWWNSGDQPSWTIMFNDGTGTDKDSPIKEEAGIWLATNDIDSGFREVILSKPNNQPYEYIGKFPSWSDSAWVIVKYHGKYGFVDKDGNLKIPLRYDDIYYGKEKKDESCYWPDEYLMSVCQNSRWGFINKRGEIVIPLKYDKLEKAEINPKYSENHYFRVIKDGYCGVIDKNGTIIIPTKYNTLEKFNPKKLMFAKYNGKYGFVDKKGTTKIAFKYDFTDGFNDNEFLAAVGINGKYGFIDTLGQTKIPLVYDFAESFENGLAPVVKNGKVGFINREGEQVIPFDYDVEFSNFQYDYNFPFSRQSLSLGCSFKYGGVAMVKKNGKYGLIDSKGNNLTLFKYENVKSAGYGGDFTVEIAGKTIYLDKMGNEYNSEEERR